MLSSVEPQPMHGIAVDALFDGLARELFGLHYTHNPVYRRFCEARKVTLKDVRSWTDIPALPAAAFKEFEVSCLSPAERTRTFCSSRTTGVEPSRNFHNPETLEVYEQSLWLWFRHSVVSRLPDGPVRVLIATPSPREAPDSSLVHMLEVVRVRLGASPSAFVGYNDPARGWQVNFAEAVTSAVRSSRTRDPVLMMGTAFSFVHLLDYLEEQGMRLALPAGSRVFETGGYKGKSRSMSRDTLYGLIEDRLGVRREDIVSEYGMSELASQAYDNLPPYNGAVDSRSFRFPPWVRATVINPETGSEAEPGEPGLLRIVDLANVGSVLALQTEDLGVSHCGGVELLGRAAEAEPKGCSLLVAG